jgi:hypothetical protein
MSRFPWDLARMISMLLAMGLIFFLSSVPGERLAFVPHCVRSE